MNHIIGNHPYRVNASSPLLAIILTILFGMLFGFTVRTSPAAGSAAFDTVLMNRVAHSNDWQKLLHYQNGESLIDSGTYFLSRNGKKDPLAELLATLTAFTEADIDRRAYGFDARCQYPYRFRSLKRYFPELVDPPVCPEVANWVKDKYAEKTILVFASEYANNPASLMGHTFLRMQRPAHAATGKQVSYLDATFNFAARIPDEVGSVSYMIRGITGGFEAGFGDETFENMIERYNNMESRDVWEYELTMTSEDTHNLLLHVFELKKHAIWDYYFFDENCSFHLLKALEAVQPEKDLTGDLTPWTIPVDTIRALSNEGLIRSWSYRPSLHTRTRIGYRSLSQPQKATFHDIRSGKKEPGQDTDVLDTLIFYLTYRKHETEGRQPESEQALYKDVLRQRAAAGPGNVQAAAQTPESPHAKTGTLRTGAGIRKNSDSSWLLADLRPAVHESKSGMGLSSSDHEVVFLAPGFRYNVSEKYLDLDYLTLLSTINYRDTNPVGFSPVWRIVADISGQNEADRACWYCKRLGVSPATGFGAAILDDQMLIVGLATLHLEYGPLLEERHRAGPGVEFQTYLHFMQLKFIARAERWWDYRKSAVTGFNLHATIAMGAKSEIWLSVGDANDLARSFELKYNLYH